jgi:hypothetical protein
MLHIYKVCRFQDKEERKKIPHPASAELFVTLQSLSFLELLKLKFSS